MNEMLRTFLKFATLGVTSEIVFTSLYQAVGDFRGNKKVDFSLKGYSYAWMIPIYGSVAVLGPALFVPLQGVFILWRLLIYTLVLFLIEYVTGWMLLKTTGKCPWHYESGWHIHHLVNLSYTPFWMFFSAMVEYFYFHY